MSSSPNPTLGSRTKVAQDDRDQRNDDDDPAVPMVRAGIAHVEGANFARMLDFQDGSAAARGA